MLSILIGKKKNRTLLIKMTYRDVIFVEQFFLPNMLRDFWFEEKWFERSNILKSDFLLQSDALVG